MLQNIKIYNISFIDYNTGKTTRSEANTHNKFMVFVLNQALFHKIWHVNFAIALKFRLLWLATASMQYVSQPISYELQ